MPKVSKVEGRENTVGKNTADRISDKIESTTVKNNETKLPITKARK